MATVASNRGAQSGCGFQVGDRVSFDLFDRKPHVVAEFSRDGQQFKTVGSDSWKAVAAYHKVKDTVASGSADPQ